MLWHATEVHFDVGVYEVRVVNHVARLEAPLVVTHVPAVELVKSAPSQPICGANSCAFILLHKMAHYWEMLKACLLLASVRHRRRSEVAWLLVIKTIDHWIASLGN